MGFSNAILEAAHKHTTGHRAELERSSVCGCFYCRRTFVPSEVGIWLDEGDGTALCPHCAVDSVIGSASGYPVAEQAFLDDMHAHWFG